MKRVFGGFESGDDGTPSKVALVERNSAPQGLSLLNSYAVGKKSAHDLVELAEEIQKADNFVRANAWNKLHMIAEQMQFLKEQAERVLLKAREESKMHHVACNFVKHPGKIYHLYERPSGQCYFSMLSPEEWGENAPQQHFKGSFRLEHDQSWTPISQIDARDHALDPLIKIIDRGTSFSRQIEQSNMQVD